MSEITIDLDDLKPLIQKLIDLEVDHYCHVLAASAALSGEQRSALAYHYKKIRPQAGDDMYRRYRSLIGAVESGKNVRSELSKLARRAGKK